MEKLLLQLIERFLREVPPIVLNLAQEQGGREVVGGVAGRLATEDEKIGVDGKLDDLFDQILRQYGCSEGIKIRVYSEHGIYGASRAEAKFSCAIDPFDGSGLFKRGLPAEWWSVLTIFDLEGRPIAGGAVDILRGELFLAKEDEVVMISLRDETREIVTPPCAVPLDRNTIIAAYFMNDDYRVEWDERTKNLRLNVPGRLTWPNGGSSIYPWLASGRVHAYMMFREPRSEIDPGLAFVEAAKLSLFCVETNGELVPYSYDPRKQRTGRVPFFIAACTEELAREIVQVVQGSS